MASYALLFDATCPPCTAVARRLREIGIDDLEVQALGDPEVIALFARSGRDVPHKPALIQIREPGLAVWTGIGMRMRLARLLGARRATEIIGLLAIETKARASRRNAATSRLTRRGLLGGAAAGIGALVFGAAVPASAKPPSDQASPLSAHEQRTVLASPAVRQAGRVWGTAQKDHIVAVESPRGEKLALVPHEGEIAALTIVSVDQADDPLGITMTPSQSGKGVRYYLPSGAPLAEQIVVEGELMTTELEVTAAPVTAEPEPLGVREFMGCFIACMGASVEPPCALACWNCLFGPVIFKPYACSTCGLCAGPRGLDCARICRNLL